MATDWNPVLRGEFAKPYWAELQQFVAERASHHTVYPPDDEVFAALHLTPFADVASSSSARTPYHGPRPGARAVLLGAARRRDPAVAGQHLQGAAADLGIQPPAHGNLEAWAARACCCSTPRSRSAPARRHRTQGKGWELFTDEVLRSLNAKESASCSSCGARRRARRSR